MTVSDRIVAGRYRLRERIGAGGMGTVWRAEDVVLGRDVALKEMALPTGLADDARADLHERTWHEARAAACIDHPCAVTVYDVVEDCGNPCLVMEYVPSSSLADLVRDGGPLTPQQAARVGLEVLGALEAAHASGVVHRDVKPGNVLVGAVDDDAFGRIVLTDFGIASSPDDPSTAGRGLLLGSPAYISPERARGRTPGPEADLWALGATLFAAVEGRPPYDEGEAVATVVAVVTGDRAPAQHAGALEPVLAGLLERDPAHRLTADEARAGLSAVARGPIPPPRRAPVQPATGASGPAADVAPPGPRWSARAPALVGAALLAVLALGGVGVAALGGAGPAPPAVAEVPAR